MRDLETISIAVTAAEMGILVMGTLHTNGAAQTVDRIINSFPANKQAHIRTMISTSLRGVVSQQLLPTKGKPGRIAALEVLMNTTAVANLIRQGKLDQLETAMQSGGNIGMQTMDSALMALVEKAFISGKEAYLQANDKSKFERLKNEN
jgi:twitching motility protein PilT